MNITEWNKEHESADSGLCNSRILAEANLPAMWSHPNSSEPDIMKVQNNIKISDPIAKPLNNDVYEFWDSTTPYFIMSWLLPWKVLVNVYSSVQSKIQYPLE